MRNNNSTSLVYTLFVDNQIMDNINITETVNNITDYIVDIDKLNISSIYGDEIYPALMGKSLAVSTPKSHESFIEKLSEIHTETSINERIFLYNFFKKYWDGCGNILEVGPFLGGSTRAIAMGMLENKNLDGRAQLITYDKFGDYYNTNRLIDCLKPFFINNTLNASDLKAINETSSFFDVFNKIHQNNDYYKLVKPVEGKLPDSSESDVFKDEHLFKIPNDINLSAVFVDGAKSWFGMKYFKTNVWDIDDMLSTFEKASNLARNEQMASFIEVKAFRLYSHSKGDDNRNPDVVNQYKLKDLINLEIARNPVLFSKLRLKINEKIDAAVALAEKNPVTINIQKKVSEPSKIEFSHIKEDDDEGKRVNELIYDGIKDQFTSNKETIMIGEDIEYLTPPFATLPYGGAFNVSKDISEKFENVFNTPISEAAITGIGTGLAIGGMKPIVEIMFGDFLTLVFDQLLNHSSKFNKMYNGQLSIPLVIRTPMGGKRGYGPTHSQSIEKFFLGIPDLTVVALNHRINPRFLYRTIFTTNNPVLVIENKVLYTKQFNTKPPIAYNITKSNETFPTIKISPKNKNPDITILCYGEILGEVEKAVELAFSEDEIICEIICPTQINPVNIDALSVSLLNTQRLLIIEEGPSVAAYGSEVSALLMEQNIFLQSFARIANNEIIPSSYEAEIKLLPNIKSIHQKIKEVCYE